MLIRKSEELVYSWMGIYLHDFTHKRLLHLVCSCQVGFGKEMVICILVVQQLNPTDTCLLGEK